MSGDHNANQKPKRVRATEGLFDNVPIVNPDRDKAWERIIKRKDMKAVMKRGEGCKFPMDGSYSVWCIAWSMAWDAGAKAGWEARDEYEKEKK